MFEYRAKLIKVVDGDTIDVEIDLGMEISHKARIRLYGINAPEMRTAEGKIAKQFVIDWFAQRVAPDEYFVLETYKDKTEKYGRYLGTVFVGVTSLNKAMVDTGNAVVNFY